ncbi:MAG: hypothetical protein U0638_08320 [Phycisphaerales bacterium]
MTPASSSDSGAQAPRGLMAFLSRPITLFPPGLSQTPARLLADAALPAPIAGLIAEVTRRTRLWPREKLDVTRELIAHFRDGIEAGRSPDDLVRDFGVPADAARLIRRAKKRCRPVAWRAMRRTLQAALLFLALVAVVYTFAAVRAFTSHPTIARNYLEELNAPIAQVPDSDRAWPLYRAAYLALPALPKELAADFPNIEPSDPRWPLALDYLAACAKSLDLARQATRKPCLGRELTMTPDAELETHSQFLAGVEPEKAREAVRLIMDRAPIDPNPPLVNLLLPHLGHGRNFARILSLDARAAASVSDNTRAAEDLEAMFRLATHMSGDAFLIGGLVELAIHAQTRQTLAQLLRDTPSLFTDEQLASFAHAASRGPSHIALNGEVLWLEDILQRVYSDDGNSDGHLTVDGARLLRSYLTSWTSTAQTDPWHGASDKVRDAFEVPFDSLVGASRKETRDLYANMISHAMTYASLAPWNRPDLSPDAEFEQFMSEGGRSRYTLVWLLMPALSKAVWSYDHAAQERDALLVAIACELYKRRFSEYPPSLDALPTSLLSQVPRDMFDGQPLRYTLRDTPRGARPVIYSVGPDRKDDAARPIANSNNVPPHWMSAQQARAQLQGAKAAEIDGDWILWPPEPRKKLPADSH